MKLTITINMDNAAFGSNGFDRYQEVKRILEQFLHRSQCFHKPALESYGNPLHDANGNSVGSWSVSED